ncbi:MAG: hypothetical protein OXQ90_07235 [Gammaproteobacteria bacterium]|nr:hypothetical protein [Gammaproteobacteria bacterium]
MSSLSEAIRLLEDGDWQAAHRIVQKDDSALASWAHGIVHLMEGDRRNAGYWYGRAGRELPVDAEISAEVAALKVQSATS